MTPHRPQPSPPLAPLSHPPFTPSRERGEGRWWRQDLCVVSAHTGAENAPMRRTTGLVLLILLLLAAPVAAQPPAADEQTEDVADPFAEALEALELDSMPVGFGDDRTVAAAWNALEHGRYVKAREIAEQILRDDPESIAGHAVLGFVHHRAEGNLPIALYHLKRSRKLYEQRWDPYAEQEDAPWRWHVVTIGELAQVSGEMGRHEDKVRYLLERDELYSPPMPADRGWPLMRLRRYDDARLAAEEALASGDQGQIAAARTALCAIEAEQQRREAGYQACALAAEYEREIGRDAPTPFTNAAEAALGVLHIDEAERLILEATESFNAYSVSNPWLDLMLLYLAEGRTPEALEALRRMLEWRRRQPAFMDEQNRAETEMASAIFLIVAGRPAEAARITQRAVDRPDRTGFTSSESEQMEAAVALVDQLAHRTRAELLAEEASWSSFLGAAKARLEARRARLRAWSSGRRAAALLTDERILLATLRPYLAGSIEIPEWIEPELTGLLGPGVVAAAVAKARSRETLPEAGGYFLAYEAEVAYLQGRERDTLRLTEQALEALPPHEALLRARITALAAEAAADAGHNSRSLELFDAAFQLDRGVIRRLGLALPASFPPAAGEVAETARRLLQRSPRLRRAGGGGGYQVAVSGDAKSGSACLLGPRGTRWACAQVKLRAGEDSEDLARRLAAEFHAQAFAPRLDLTQADIRSLDGSPTAGGGRASDRLQGVLSELIPDDG